MVPLSSVFPFSDHYVHMAMFKRDSFSYGKLVETSCMDVAVVNHIIMRWSTTYDRERKIDTTDVHKTTSKLKMCSIPLHDNAISSFQAFRPAISIRFRKQYLVMHGIDALFLSSEFINWSFQSPLFQWNWIFVSCATCRKCICFESNQNICKMRKKTLFNSGAFNAQNNCVVTKCLLWLCHKFKQPGLWVGTWTSDGRKNASASAVFP